MWTNVMRLGAGNHGPTAAARSFTVAVMALATFAQFASLSHEMTVRHFRCAEHGELTHVVALAGELAAAPAAETGGAALRAPGGEAADAHEHCSVAFTVEGRGVTPAAGDVTGTVALPPAVLPAPDPLAAGGRAFVLASAPKTSPPRA
jgi:hypothetical protein